MFKQGKESGKNVRISKLKIIAMIIFIVMTFHVIAPTTYAVSEVVTNTDSSTEATAGTTTDEETTDETKIPTIIGEDASKREENVKKFRLDNGTEIAAVYPEPVHYMQDGEFVDIDNSFTDAVDDISDQVLKNKANSFSIELAKQTNSNKLVSIKSKDYKINWSLINANKVKVNQSTSTPALSEQNNQYKNSEKLNLKNLQSSVTYKDILDNIDIEYVVESTKVKENIVLKSSEAINQSLEFRLDVGNKLKAELSKDKQIIIYETSIDKPIYIMDRLFMYDSKQEYSEDIEAKLEATKKKGEYILTVVPSIKWLEDLARMYPVTIDPSMSFMQNNGVYDGFIYDGDSTNTTRRSAPFIDVGNNSITNPKRGIVKFNLPILDLGDQVIDATFSLYNYQAVSGWSAPADFIIDVHKITKDWAVNDTSCSWANLSSSYAPKVIDNIMYSYSATNPNKKNTLNVTSVVKDWYVNSSNYGLMLKEHVEKAGVNKDVARFVSADSDLANYRPSLTITYRNQIGLEDYLSYHTQNVGRAGTIYTNDYSGNLTLVHTDVTTPGNRLPVTINHIYNSCNKNLSSPYGKGWQLNLSQKITTKTIGGTNYAIYTDEDGTNHYFTKDSGNTSTYTSEENLGLSLVYSSSLNTYTLTDQNGNVKKFVLSATSTTSWLLKEISDTDGNKITINLNTADSITSVTDGSGATVNFAYDSTTGMLTSITYNGGKVNKYSYDSLKDLTAISYPDGKTSNYSYTNLTLITAQNIDGSKVYYTYNNTAAGSVFSRVTNIQEYSKLNSSGKPQAGNKLTITYGNNVTTFADNNGYKQSITFNNMGQAIGIADFGKETVDLSNVYGKSYEFGDSGGAKNKLTLEGQLIKPVNNLIYNGGAENNGQWALEQLMTNAGTGSISTAKAYSGTKSISLSSIYNSNSCPIYRSVPSLILKGKTYTLSAQVLAVPGETWNGGGAVLVAYYNDSTGSKKILYSPEIIGDTNNTWKKTSFTFDYPSNASGPLYIGVALKNAKGTAYFDEIQLEEGTVSNAYNLIENSSFKDSRVGWLGSNITNADSVVAVDGSNAFKFEGDHLIKNIYQDVNLTGNAGDIFTVSTWYKSGGINLPDAGKNISLEISFTASNNVTQYIDMPLNAGSETWQYFSKQLNAPCNYKQITVRLTCDWNINQTYYTNINLFRNDLGNSYSYDSKGNIISTTNSANQTDTFVYNANNNVTNATSPDGGTISYTYDTTYPNRLLSATNNLGIKNSFTYDTFGNTTTSKVLGADNTTYIQSGAQYSTNGKYQTTVTDERGNATSYVYNANTGTIQSVTDPKSETINYEYDSMDKLTRAYKSNGNNTYDNVYTYENDNLKTIQHNGTTYNFNYDLYGNIQDMKIGTQNLITNVYGESNGNLLNSTYGNNQQISYGYDRFNQLISQTRAEGTYNYEYDAKANLVNTYNPDGTKESLIYDYVSKTSKIVNSNGFIKENRFLGKDANNNDITGATYKLEVSGNNYLNNISYYQDKNNRPLKTTFDGTTQTTNYDTLSRESGITTTAGVKTYTTTYGYLNTGTTNRTTSLLGSIQNGSNATLNYTYDANGNIATISNGSTLQQKYYYDVHNELLREDNVQLNKTITYAYDNGGNITWKTEYPYTTGQTGTTATKTYAYTYGNSNWKDQLTNYDGKAITYDAIGNPITYNGNTYTWQNGRELTKIVNGSNTYQYKYNDNGIRTEKNVNGTVTKYYLEGTKVIYEVTGSNTTYYQYNDAGNLIGFKYNAAQYYYIKNGQGDIIGILDHD